MRKSFLIPVFIAIALVVMAISPRGVEARRQFTANRACCDLSVLQALNLTFQQALGGPSYPSEIGQDKWVIFKMFPGVHDGVFLDVGSGHGTIGSNTKALEELQEGIRAAKRMIFRRTGTRQDADGSVRSFRTPDPALTPLKNAKSA